MTNFVLDESVGFLINRTAVNLKRELLRGFRREGHPVTAEQWAILNRLWEQEGLSQVQLAERTLNDKPNVTRMVGVLEANGLIYRRPSNSDGRAFEVYLTPDGKRIKDELIELAVEVLDRALRGLDEDDIAHLKRVLERIDANLREGKAGSGR